MVDVSNSFPLTSFQRNARKLIHTLNVERKPALLTVNGKVEAVLVDPQTYQRLEDLWERECFVHALREGIEDVVQGRVRPLEDVVNEARAKYGL